jgi:hypothetical protein
MPKYRFSFDDKFENNHVITIIPSDSNISIGSFTNMDSRSIVEFNYQQQFAKYRLGYKSKMLKLSFNLYNLSNNAFASVLTNPFNDNRSNCIIYTLNGNCVFIGVQTNQVSDINENGVVEVEFEDIFKYVTSQINSNVIYNDYFNVDGLITIGQTFGAGYLQYVDIDNKNYYLQELSSRNISDIRIKAKLCTLDLLEDILTTIISNQMNYYLRETYATNVSLFDNLIFHKQNYPNGVGDTITDKSEIYTILYLFTGINTKIQGGLSFAISRDYKSLYEFIQDLSESHFLTLQTTHSNSTTIDINITKVVNGSENIDTNYFNCTNRRVFSEGIKIVQITPTEKIESSINVAYSENASNRNNNKYNVPLNMNTLPIINKEYIAKVNFLIPTSNNILLVASKFVNNYIYLYFDGRKANYSNYAKVHNLIDINITDTQTLTDFVNYTDYVHSDRSSWVNNAIEYQSKIKLEMLYYSQNAINYMATALLNMLGDLYFSEVELESLLPKDNIDLCTTNDSKRLIFDLNDYYKLNNVFTDVPNTWFINESNYDVINGRTKFKLITGF